MKIKLVITSAVLIFAAFLGWLFVESSKPLPGQKFDNEGRDHVEISTEVSYKTNPPTSGKHYSDWIRAGIYDEPKDDRNLVHSLEHGYVIISYNCDKKGTVYAHGIEDEASSSSTEATSSALPTSFTSEDCHKLVDQLISIYEKKGKKKIIVVPRPNLDSRIALSAWTYLDKFDTFDQVRIEKFIDAHRDQGPERTME